MEGDGVPCQLFIYCYTEHKHFTRISHETQCILICIQISYLGSFSFDIKRKIPAYGVKQ